MRLLAGTRESIAVYAAVRFEPREDRFAFAGFFAASAAIDDGAKRVLGNVGAGLGLPPLELVDADRAHRADTIAVPRFIGRGDRWSLKAYDARATGGHDCGAAKQPIDHRVSMPCHRALWGPV